MEREDGPRSDDREEEGAASLAPDSEGFERRVAQYLEWMRVSHYSEETVTHRAFVLSHFVSWCADRGLTRPAEVTRPIMERYQEAVFHYRTKKEAPLHVTTQRTYIESVKGLFKWLARANLVLYNPAGDLVLPRRAPQLPTYVLTEEEAERILAQPDVSTPRGVRDRALLEVLYSTGMRRTELARLRLIDLDSGGGTVRVREGKGRKQRVVPIGERALAWVDKYLADVRSRLVVEPDEGFVFLGKQGRPLSADTLTRLGHGYRMAAGIAKRGAVHIFRHTCATTMLDRGADVRFLQAMLGHARMETTEIYTHVSIAKLKEVHAATHPASATRSAPTAAPPRVPACGPEAATPPSASPPSPPSTEAATPPGAKPEGSPGR